jgi:plasmid stabilization system protein ParE
MAYDYKLFWSDEAINNLESTLDYLQSRWTQREVDIFKKRLSKQLNLITNNPKLFPKSDYNPGLRKAVLSKQTTIFYEISGKTINLVYLFNNRQDIEVIKNTHNSKI